MDDVKTQDRPTIISSEDARGALSTKAGTFGDTLLPMLVIGTGLAVIAIGVVAYIIWP
jgi:hypothetical protein